MPVCVYNKAMYSVKEAAEKLGLDTSQVRRLLAKGEIKGKKLARDWVVLELNYKRRRKPKTKRNSL
jgi:excisionase family DNA binding protein